MKPDNATVDSAPAHVTAPATKVAVPATPAVTQACVATDGAPYCVVCPLSDLGRGGCARVVRLAGAPRLQRRLMALGLRPSAELAVLGRAPGNGPLELRAGTVHLMLRACEAREVMVEVDDASTPLSPTRQAPTGDAYALPTV